jgi:hypothetical protein
VAKEVVEGAGVSIDGFSIHEFLNPLYFFAIASPFSICMRLKIVEIELICTFLSPVSSSPVLEVYPRRSTMKYILEEEVQWMEWK